MSDAPDPRAAVPGFEFLQSLVKNAGSALPGIGSWVAPTLDPKELDKRIGELRTVQFWLEQNGRMIATTIQALEVQRMTLSTLQTMNVQMGDLRDSLFARPAAAGGEAKAAAAEMAQASPAESAAAPPQANAANAAPAVDPMKWWSALTDQFTQIASSAMKETAAAASLPPAATKRTTRPSAKSAKSAASTAPARPARRRS